MRTWICLLLLAGCGDSTVRGPVEVVAYSKRQGFGTVASTQLQ